MTCYINWQVFSCQYLQFSQVTHTYLFMKLLHTANAIGNITLDMRNYIICPGALNDIQFIKGQEVQEIRISFRQKLLSKRKEKKKKGGGSFHSRCPVFSACINPAYLLCVIFTMCVKTFGSIRCTDVNCLSTRCILVSLDGSKT